MLPHLAGVVHLARSVQRPPRPRSVLRSLRNFVAPVCQNLGLCTLLGEEGIPLSALTPKKELRMPGQPGSDKRFRKNIVRVRMSDAELSMLNAKRGTWSQAQFLREAARVQGQVLAIDVAPILGALGKIGSNLNQIARAANTRPGSTDPILIDGELAELREVIARLSSL